ncbi:F0F1 ATP synthase subunit epsilon [Rhodanobacter sp. AS-Z3]|uniref:F0F1 ATP synthase subunit epsilon n=1 Tax=Rhodanobacter sp. AS-Z3 TaxID=3031330 RepID=UPI002479110B|nr:F0F1 ATP synthase subunit epsilon [Rhodanobacter sp. AS-Z3]WEN16570.1 F0F1 ATP synthase subunit epsilon [Rhodanobacter sp. AS-Z3]
MRLEVLLPYGVFLEQNDVSRIVAETSDGSLGLLPHRLDCAAALVPGILTYATQQNASVYIAVDEGVMVKAGDDVLVSVRRAIGGKDLGELQEAVKREFLTVDEQQRSVRAALDRLESGLMSRLAEFPHER